MTQPLAMHSTNGSSTGSGLQAQPTVYRALPSTAPEKRKLSQAGLSKMRSRPPASDHLVPKKPPDSNGTSYPNASPRLFRLYEKVKPGSDGGSSIAPNQGAAMKVAVLNC